MANYSTLKHSKALGKMQIFIFSTLASILNDFRLEGLDLCRATAEV